jgi:hypothetical protein
VTDLTWESRRGPEQIPSVARQRRSPNLPNLPSLRYHTIVFRDQPNLIRIQFAIKLLSKSIGCQAADLCGYLTAVVERSSSPEGEESFMIHVRVLPVTPGCFPYLGLFDIPGQEEQDKKLYEG